MPDSYQLPDAVTVDTFVSTNIDDHVFPDLFANSNLGAEFSGSSSGGAEIVTVESPPKDSCLINSFYQDYYFRIHLIPSLIEFGNIVGDQTENFTVWNSYPQQVTLSAVNAQGADGVAIVGATSGAFETLEERQYSVDVESEGEPTIQALFSFVFDVETVDLEVEGNRVVLFPYIPENQIDERLTWATDLIEAHSQDQAIATMAEAGQSFSYRYKVGEAEFTHMSNLVSGIGASVYAVPVFTEAQAVGDLVASQTVISVDTRFSDYREGGIVVIYTSYQDAEAAQIESFDDSTITLKSGLSKAFTGGLIAPIRECYMMSGISGSRVASGRTTIDSNFRSINNVELTEAYPQHNGFDVYEGCNAVLRDMDVSVVQPSALIDSGAGAFKLADSRSVTYTKSTHGFLVEGMESIWDMRKWLHARKGKARSFYLSTNTSDLVATDDLSQGSFTFRVNAVNLRYLKGKEFDLAVTKTDSSKVYLHCTDVNLDAFEEVITVDNIPENILQTEISKISFLNLFRYEADGITIKHDGQRASASVPARQL